MDCRTTTTRSVFSSLALLFCVSATLAGCKSGGGGSGSSGAPIAASASTTPVVTPAPAPTPAPTPDPVTAPAPTPAPEQNTAPKISGSTIASVTANSLYSFKPAASDADGDALVFQIQNKPSWATFSTITGQLSGTPKTADAGTFPNIAISVNDGAATTAMPMFSIAVTNPTVNSAKLAWAAPTQNTDGSTLSDLAGFTIVYGTSQSSLDQTVRIDNATASTYTLDNFPSGTYYFAIKAFTAGGAESALSAVVTKAFN